MRGLLNLRPLTASLVLGVAAAGLTATTVPPASAAGVLTAYVAQGGIDADNDCSSAAAPCATVSRALTQVGKGATVRVSGTVVDHVEVHGDKDPLLITGAGASTPAVLRAHESSGVVSNFGDLRLEHLEITGGDTGGSAGGAVANTGGELALSHVVVRGNTADKGGGVYNDNEGTVTIEDSRVVDNVATGLGGGGGLYNTKGAITVRRSLFAGNTASGGVGGGIGNVTQLGRGTVVVEDSTISGNGAVNGGGLYATGGLTLARSTVAENQATFGAGIWNSVGTSWLVGSTVAGNVATVGVGGIHNDLGRVEIASTIIGPQTGAGCGGNSSTFVSAGHNIDAGTSCGLAGTGDQSGTDPLLGPLQDNGGARATLLPDATGPAADRIPVGTAFYAYPMCDRYDQRGVPGPVAGASGCSVGAVEPAAFVPIDQAPLTLDTLSGPIAAPLALTASGGSGAGLVTFTATDGSASGCTVSGTPPYTLGAEGAGTCTVTAHKAAWGVYRSVSSAPTAVTLARIEQAELSVTSTSGVFGTPLTLTSEGGTGTGEVTYAAANGTASGCQVGGAGPYRLTSTTAGTCTVTATKAGDAIRLPATSAPTTVTFAPAAQAGLVVTSTSGRYGTPLPLTTGGGSGSGAVSYEVSDGTASCELDASGPWHLEADAPGTCAVTATKAADGSYAEAGSPTVVVTFEPGLQAPLVLTSTVGTVGQALPLTSSGGSGVGAVTFAATDGTAGSCTVSDAPPYTLHAVSAGTCEVTVTKAADLGYEETSTTATVTFVRPAQAPLVLTSTQGTFGGALNLRTGGGSGPGAVSYAVARGTAAACTLRGSTLTVSTAGTCWVTATKAGSAGFEPVSSARTTVRFAAVRPGAVRALRVSGKAVTARRVVTWTAPRSTGGVPITRYVVTVTKGARKVSTTTTRSRKVILKRARLPRGRLTVSVVARTAAGTGPAVRRVVTVRR